MTLSGVFPKIDGDDLWSYDVNQMVRLSLGVYNNIFIGSLSTGSPLGSTVTLPVGCKSFTIYNEGVVNTYIVLGSPASVISGMYLMPDEFLNIYSSGANQISALTISGGGLLKYIAQY